MRKILRIILFLIAIVFAACSGDNDVSRFNSAPADSQSRVTDAAIGFAKSILSETPGTRAQAVSELTVKSVSEFPVGKVFGTNAKTRSLESTTHFYSVALANNQGTVIMAASDGGGTKPLAYLMDENDIDVQNWILIL